MGDERVVDEGTSASKTRAIARGLVTFGGGHKTDIITNKQQLGRDEPQVGSLRHSVVEVFFFRLRFLWRSVSFHLPIILRVELVL